MNTLIDKYLNRYKVTHHQLAILYVVNIALLVGCVAIVSTIYYP